MGDDPLSELANVLLARACRLIERTGRAVPRAADISCFAAAVHKLSDEAKSESRGDAEAKGDENVVCLECAALIFQAAASLHNAECNTRNVLLHTIALAKLSVYSELIESGEVRRGVWASILKTTDHGTSSQHCPPAFPIQLQ